MRTLSQILGVLLLLASPALSQTALDEKTVAEIKAALDRLAAADSSAAPDNGGTIILSDVPDNGSSTILLRQKGETVLLHRAIADDNGTIGVLWLPIPDGNGVIGVLRVPVAENGFTGVLSLPLSELTEVSEVTKVVGVLGENEVRVTASGNVPTSGWSDATLFPNDIVNPPNGIYRFAFVARKPADNTLQVVTAIETPELRIPLQPMMKGISVRAGTSKYVLRFLQHRSGQTPEPIDMVEIESAELADEVLHVNVRYSGGCADHDFELVWSGTYLESNPPVAKMRLLHNGNHDVCDAYLPERLHFALPSLDPCVIRIENGQGGSADVRYKLPN